MEGDYVFAPTIQAGVIESLAHSYAGKWKGTLLIPAKRFFPDDVSVPDDVQIRISTVPVLLVSVEHESSPGTAYGTFDELCCKLQSEYVAGELQQEVIDVLTLKNQMAS